MKNRVMIIGGVQAGKSTLMNALLGKNSSANKTQALVYEDWIVDTPGEYIENPLYYRNIMATSLEVTHVIYLQDATSSRTVFPPQFSLGIPKIQIGVITKIDHPQADAERAASLLKNVMMRGPIVKTSALEKRGIEFIAPLIELNDTAAIKQFVLDSASPYLEYCEP
ncbi:EutP/PduV family microcompartment system protein [Metasolibacillus sp. FSL K6-0083]|uniref:EutP/PduV family microcompartment system protein n=1 Tax=Metasolibacillus sp. FSL K6-0083 TaxID=2921416 RepID=UPI0007974B75|nr:ethanolamine utilization protein EutP [[Bacillus] sp. KCTC 13219]